MRLSRKDWADAGVFNVGAAAGLFFAFMPFAVDRRWLSLGECGWIGAGLIGFALICFLISKFEEVKERRIREKAERRRDRIMARIVMNEVEALERRGDTKTRRYRRLRVAEDLYRYAGAKDVRRKRSIGSVGVLLSSVGIERKKLWKAIEDFVDSGVSGHIVWMEAEGHRGNTDEIARKFADQLFAEAMVGGQGE